MCTCIYGTEFSGSIECGKIFDCLKNRWLLNNDPGPWCYLTLRRLMSYIYIYIYIYIYGAPILDVSRSHTTTQHSR